MLDCPARSLLNIPEGLAYDPYKHKADKPVATKTKAKKTNKIAPMPKLGDPDVGVRDNNTNNKVGDFSDPQVVAARNATKQQASEARGQRLLSYAQHKQAQQQRPLVIREPASGSNSSQKAKKDMLTGKGKEKAPPRVSSSDSSD